MLSLLSLFPALPMAAGLSAAHLSALLFPPGLRRLYVLRDNDAAGDFAEERLAERCREAGIDCRVLKPAAKDLNIDLRDEPVHAVKGRMLAQMEPEDRSRFAADPNLAIRARNRRRRHSALHGVLRREEAALAPLRVARKPEPRAEGNGWMSVYFPPRPPKKVRGPLCIAKQNKRPLAVLRCATAARLCRRGAAPARASGQEPRHQGREGRLTTQGGQTMTTFHDIDADLHEPGHQSSATARVIEDLALYGYQPSAGEPDPRPLPDTDL